MERCEGGKPERCGEPCNGAPHVIQKVKSKGRRSQLNFRRGVIGENPFAKRVLPLDLPSEARQNSRVVSA